MGARSWLLFGGWLVGSLMIGEHYPFSRYPMYAQLPSGPTAVPGFVANTKRASIDDFERFSGFAVPPGHPPVACTMGYRMEELRLAVDRNRSEGGASGGVPVALGWWVLGEGEPYFVVGSEGMAWPIAR